MALPCLILHYKQHGQDQLFGSMREAVVTTSLRVFTTSQQFTRCFVTKLLTNKKYKRVWSGYYTEWFKWQAFLLGSNYQSWALHFFCQHPFKGRNQLINRNQSIPPCCIPKGRAAVHFILGHICYKNWFKANLIHRNVCGLLERVLMCQPVNQMTCHSTHQHFQHSFHLRSITDKCYDNALIFLPTEIPRWCMTIKQFNFMFFSLSTSPLLYLLWYIFL